MVAASGKEPIRVLHILQRMEGAGVQTLLMSIYRNIDRTKVQFDFLVHYKEPQLFDDEIEKLGGHVYKLSVREDHNLPLYFRELKRFFDLHKEYKIVHGHMPVLGYFYFRAAHKSGVPVIVAHAHTDKHYNNLKGYIACFMRKLYPIYATDYFACSESAGKYIFGNRDFKILKNAIMTEKFVYDPAVRSRKRIELGLGDKFVVGHAARFAEHKNHDFLVDIFCEIQKKIPDSILLLAGDGELRPKIEEKVKQLGIADHVKFLGVRSDINELYQVMDAFVFPSIFEGLGIVNIEAQAAGVMTFCSDAVPQEANISPLFTTIPLSKTASEWANVIIDKCKNRECRTDMTSYIVQAGYDAKALSNELQEFYLRKYSEFSV